jgi:hypothetical protein
LGWAQTPLVRLQPLPPVQALHAAPFVPHPLAVSFATATHAPAALQHPFGHDVASHTHFVPLQRCPVEQTEHAPPAVPHAAAVSLVEHVVALLQHPVAQDVASHTHVPCALHSWPVPHD